MKLPQNPSKSIYSAAKAGIVFFSQNTFLKPIIAIMFKL